MNITEKLSGLAFENGYDVLQEGGLAIVGMSPGNSYFKKGTINELLKFCASKFSQVRIMVADKPMEHSYKALGYSCFKAKKKARLSGNTLKNHSLSTISGLVGDVKLIEWEKEIDQHASHNKEFKKIISLYEGSNKFRQEVRETTRKVLKNKLREAIAIEDAIDEGVFYLLKELAFLSASPEIFGIQKVTYVYHDHFEVFEHFVSGIYNGHKRGDLGFVIIS